MIVLSPQAAPPGIARRAAAIPPPEPAWAARETELADLRAGPRSGRAHSGREGVRGLMAGHGAPPGSSWALRWTAAFIVVFGTLAMRLYDLKWPSRQHLTS